jgi:hypothetical protein
MDDPTRRCENDTDHGDALLGALVPKQGPHFFAHAFLEQVGPPFLAALVNPSLSRNPPR